MPDRCALLAVVGVLGLAACGGDDAAGGDDGETLDPPADCAVNQLAYVHTLDLGGGMVGDEGTIAVGGYSFANKLGTQAGELIIYRAETAMDPPLVHLRFDTLVMNSGTVPARATLEIPAIGVVAGNCDTEPNTGTLIKGTSESALYQFVVRDLHAGGTCDGALIPGAFAACLRGQ